MDRLPPSPLLFSSRMKQKGIQRMFFLPAKEISGASSVALRTARCAVPCRAGSSWGAAGCRAGSAPAALCPGLSCRAKGKGLWAATWPCHQPRTKARRQWVWFSCLLSGLLAATTPGFLSGWPRRTAGPILVLQVQHEWHWGKAGDTS